MEEYKYLQAEYEKQIGKFLDEFMFIMYKGNEHIIARKYYHDLFNELIPKYFCTCKNDDSEIESRTK